MKRKPAPPSSVDDLTYTQRDREQTLAEDAETTGQQPRHDQGRFIRPEEDEPELHEDTIDVAPVSRERPATTKREALQPEPQNPPGHAPP